ncbi:MAG: STAS domain-containing protein [Planctomycetes bacterium]|nr:STAS domain-containing protein [Planctomycetota bacterium]
MQLSIISIADNHAHIGVKGEISGLYEAVANPFETLLGENAYAKTVLLNLEKTTMIDSSGIGWLITSFKRFAQNKGRLVLHTIPPLISQVLKLVHLEKIIECEIDYAHACQLLSPQPAKP